MFYWSARKRSKLKIDMNYSFMKRIEGEHPRRIYKDSVLTPSFLDLFAAGNLESPSQPLM